MQVPLSSPTTFHDFPDVSTASLADSWGLAHDASNLLGALQLYCDLLEAPGVLSSEHRHYVTELRLLSDRSGSLIRQLLPKGQSARGQQRAVPVAETVQAFIPLLRSVAAPDATVSVAIGGELGTLPFEEEVLERILVNLVRNAASAILANAGAAVYPGHIHIGLCALVDGLRLTVLDNGPGMPPGAASEFLDPRPRQRMVRGLGHRVVRELVGRTGGRVDVAVTPGRGTLVELEWPVNSETKVPQQTTH